MLEMTQVSAYFNGPEGIVQALDDVSLKIPKGEFAAVSGPSGCGKTTLLLMAGGLLAPGDGRIRIDGTDPYGLAQDDRARFRAENIGFVFQQFYLVPYLSVLDNVRSPALAVPGMDGEKRALELIEQFRLTERKNHVPSELSTGERQRAAMARAVFNNPKLILADEPTGNLDRDNARIVLDFFAGFAGSGGSVLMVTHDDSITTSAHRIIRLKNGHIQNDN